MTSWIVVARILISLGVLYCLGVIIYFVSNFFLLSRQAKEYGLFDAIAILISVLLLVAIIQAIRAVVFIKNSERVQAALIWACSICLLASLGNVTILLYLIAPLLLFAIGGFIAKTYAT